MLRSLLLLLLSSAAFSQILTYPLTDATANIIDGNITASNFTSSSAATPSGGEVSRNGWGNASLDVSNYYQFSLSPNSDYNLTISQITFDIGQSGAQGGGAEPINFQVLITTDASFSSYTSIHTGVAPAASSTSVTVNLASNNTADETETLYIRISGYNAGHNNHNLIVSNTPSISGSVNSVNSVEFATEPSLTDSTRTSLSLNWETTHNATAHIAYGTTSGVYTDTAAISDGGTVDNVTLTGLTVNTTYYMQIGMYAASISDSTVSSEYTFSTNPNLTFTSAADTTVVGRNSATIAWQTNIAAQAKIAYGLTTSYGDTADFALANTDGSLELTGLTDNTAYNYQVIAFTNDQDTVRSSNGTFNTDLDVGQVEAGDIIINEIMYDDNGSPANRKEDWVELYNTTNSSIDLTNWVLRVNDATDITIPSGTITAGGYAIVVVDAGNETTHSPAELVAGAVDIDASSTLALYADLSRTVLVDGDVNTSYNNPSISTGSTIERNTSGNYADAWSESTLDATGYDGDGNILRGTPQARNSNDLRTLQLAAVSMSSLNLADDQGTYQVFRFTLNSISESTPISGVTITNTGSTDLSSVNQAQLLLADSVIATINSPGATNTLNFTGITLDRFFNSSVDTMKLNITYNSFSSSQAHQFRLSDASSIVSDGYTSATGSFAITGPSVNYDLTYNLGTVANVNPSQVASTESWMGYFTIDQINTVTEVTIQNRVDVGSVDQSDIAEVRIYVTGSTADPTGGTVTGSIAQSGADGGQGIITFGAPQTTNGTFFHVVYLLAGTVNQSNSIGAQISDIDFSTPMTLNGSLPAKVSNDITLPVSLAPMEFVDRGNKGVKILIKTYSEASPSLLKLMRRADGEDVQTLITEFMTNGSVSHGKEYQIFDNSALYNKTYTYNLYEDGVLTDKSLTITRVPQGFSVSNNYPNPFNPTTSVSILISERANLYFAIYNSLGQRVFTDTRSNVSIGEKVLMWNGLNQRGQSVASGVYFMEVRLQATASKNSLNRIQKIVLLK